MNATEIFLREFEQEMANTRRLLEIVPEDKAAWKPHAKSWSLGDLSLHIANLPAWAVALPFSRCRGARCSTRSCSAT